jgi:paraquat-inducible protein B
MSVGNKLPMTEAKGEMNQLTRQQRRELDQLQLEQFMAQFTGEKEQVAELMEMLLGGTDFLAQLAADVIAEKIPKRQSIATLTKSLLSSRVQRDLIARARTLRLLERLGPVPRTSLPIIRAIGKSPSHPRVAAIAKRVLQLSRPA